MIDEHHDTLSGLMLAQTDDRRTEIRAALACRKSWRRQPTGTLIRIIGCYSRLPEPLQQRRAYSIFRDANP